MLYFRCKNSQGEGCKASVICKGGNLTDCVLSIAHSHNPMAKNLTNVKFLKVIEKILSKNPFKKALEVYNEAKDELRGVVDMSHIGELSKSPKLITNVCLRKLFCCNCIEGASIFGWKVVLFFDDLFSTFLANEPFLTHFRLLKFFEVTQGSPISRVEF